MTHVTSVTEDRNSLAIDTLLAALGLFIYVDVGGPVLIAGGLAVAVALIAHHRRVAPSRNPLRLAGVEIP
jgi:hypothetical protein